MLSYEDCLQLLSTEHLKLRLLLKYRSSRFDGIELNLMEERSMEIESIFKYAY